MVCKSKMDSFCFTSNFLKSHRAVFEVPLEEELFSRLWQVPFKHSDAS
jgi:hypothetical protein